MTQVALYFQLYCCNTHTHTHKHTHTHSSPYFGCIKLLILINLQKTNVKYVAMYFSSHITTVACRHPSVSLHPSSKCKILPIMQVSKPSYYFFVLPLRFTLLLSLFQNIFHLCSSLSITRPHATTCTLTVHYIYIFTFLHSRAF